MQYILSQEEVDAIATLSKYKCAYNRVRPLVEAIAAWETEKGSSALIFNTEYAEFMDFIHKGLAFSSCRGAVSEISGIEG